MFDIKMIGASSHGFFSSGNHSQEIIQNNTKNLKVNQAAELTPQNEKNKQNKINQNNSGSSNNKKSIQQTEQSKNTEQSLKEYKNLEQLISSSYDSVASLQKKSSRINIKKETILYSLRKTKIESVFNFVEIQYNNLKEYANKGVQAIPFVVEGICLFVIASTLYLESRPKIKYSITSKQRKNLQLLEKSMFFGFGFLIYLFLKIVKIFINIL